MAVISNKIPKFYDKVKDFNINQYKVIFDSNYNLILNKNNQIVRYFGKIETILGEIQYYNIFGSNEFHKGNYDLKNVKIPRLPHIENYYKNIHLKILEKINNFNDEFMYNDKRNTGDIEIIFNIDDKKVPFLLHKFTLLRCSEFMRRCINFNKNNDKNNIKKRKTNDENEDKKEENKEVSEDYSNDKMLIDIFHIKISSQLTPQFFMLFLYGVITIFPLDIQLSYELYQLFDYLQIDNYNEIFAEYIRSLCLAYNFLDVVKVYGIDSPLLKKLEIKIIS